MSGVPDEPAVTALPAPVGEAFYHNPAEPLPEEASALWEVNSRWWQDGFTEGADAEYNEQIVPLLEAHLMRAGAEAGPLDILDIGCGEGQLSRLAARTGHAHRVTGIDPAVAQLTVALQRQPPPAAASWPGGTGTGGSGGAGEEARPVLPVLPEYVRASAVALPFQDYSFDAAFACLVFEHIEGAAAALGEVARVLRPGGLFLLFLNHPLLQAPGSGWVDDHILEEQYWRIGPYLPEHHGVEEVDKDVWIPFVHRPLSVYVNALAAAGMYVTSMLEPPPPAGFLRRAEEYEQASAFPRLLVLKVEKLRLARAGS